MNKKYLITGGTGFLGSKLIEKLYDNNNVINVISRNEGKLVLLKNKFPNINIISGDISDKFSTMQACKDIDYIFHLAAFKHVTMAEKMSRECIKTNIIGSINLLDETLVNEIKLIIGISTDKAAQISGIYGASKYCMEKLFQQYENINDKTKYRIVRYGNVLNSTGSILPKWVDCVTNNKDIIITDRNATRFFWSIDEAIQLIFDCIENSKNSDPYIPEMKAAKIGDLLEAVIKKYSNNFTGSIKEIGLQKGENLHEIIEAGGKYSNEVYQYSVDELVEII